MKLAIDTDNKIFALDASLIDFEAWVGGDTPNWPTDEIILAANFDSNLTDYYGNDGAWSGTPLYDATGFKDGNGCLDMTPIANTAYVDFTDVDSYFYDAFSAGGFSLSFWMWNDYAGSGTTQQWKYFMNYGLGYAPNNGWDLTRYGHSEIFINRFNNNINGNELSAWNDKSWDHFIYSANWTTGNLLIYKNDVKTLDKTGSFSAISDVGHSLRLGADPAGSQNTVLTKIGPLRVYNKILTSAERTQLYEEFD